MQSDVRAFLITNPRAGRGRVDLSEAITILQAHGWEVAVRQKLRGGHATELARDAVRLQCCRGLWGRRHPE
jgi:diacylglycerol kinase family enzyme